MTHPSTVADTLDAGHTPGPWRVAYDDANGQAVVSSEHTEIATCWHHCVGSIEKQMRANARLIAAAPDLLAALIDAENIFHGTFAVGGTIHKQMIAAIAKARGEVQP